LVEVDTIKDLGVTFQSNLSFSSHIDNSCAKALKRLGFLIRCTKEFNDELCIKTLYIHLSLVRPLEYCSVLWNSSQSGHIESLERVQMRFLRLIFYKRRLGFDPSLPCSTLTSIQSSLNLVSLNIRRELLDLSFLAKLVKGTIACSDLLHLLNFYVPKFNFRSFPIFVIPFHHTFYVSNNPIDRISAVCNRLNNRDNFYLFEYC